MSWIRPTLEEIKSRIVTDITSRLIGKVSLLKIALLKILAWVFAGAIHIVYGYVEEIIKQLMVDTAVGKWLDRHAFIWGITRKSASFASGNVVFKGTTGTTINKNTLIESSTGIQYITTAAGTIANGYATIPVQALLSGITGNLDAPAKFELVNYISGVEDTCYTGIYNLEYVNMVGGLFAVGDDITNATQAGFGYILAIHTLSIDIIILEGNFDSSDVIDNGDGVEAIVVNTPINTNEVNGGIDLENDEDLRARILERIRKQPAGGAGHDYERWAKEVPGVEKAWALKATPSAGWVTIVIKANGTNPIPSATLLSTVLTYLVERQCVTADLLVVPIEAAVIDFEISITPNEIAYQDLIVNNIDQLFIKAGEPGVDQLLTKIQNAISTTGINNYIITEIRKNDVVQSIANIDLIGYEYPTLNTITFASL